MNSFNKALQKLCNAIFKGFYLFAAFTFTVLLTILLINVISRNLLGGSIAWIEEISRYIFTWMMFMGIAIGVHYKKHLGVEFVVGLYPAKVKKAAYFISDVLTLHHSCHLRFPLRGQEHEDVLPHHGHPVRHRVPVRAHRRNLQHVLLLCPHH